MEERLEPWAMRLSVLRLTVSVAMPGAIRCVSIVAVQLGAAGSVFSVVSLAFPFPRLGVTTSGWWAGRYLGRGTVGRRGGVGQRWTLVLINKLGIRNGSEGRPGQRCTCRGA